MDAVAAVNHALSDEPAQILRLGLPDEYADGPLPRVLTRFARIHPRVALEVECAASGVLETQLNDGRLDLAMALQEEIDRPGEPLLEDPTTWVASARDPLPGNEAPLPLAVFDNACSWRRWAVDSLERAGIDYRIAYTSRSVPAIRAAIRAGIGVGLLGASTLTDDLRPYPPMSGTVTMPASQLVLLRGPNHHPEVEDTLRKLIVEALGR